MLSSLLNSTDRSSFLFFFTFGPDLLVSHAVGCNSLRSGSDHPCHHTICQAFCFSSNQWCYPVSLSNLFPLLSIFSFSSSSSSFFAQVGPVFSYPNSSCTFPYFLVCLLSSLNSIQVTYFFFSWFLTTVKGKMRDRKGLPAFSCKHRFGLSIAWSR